jgi:hypothetical protein
MADNVKIAKIPLLSRWLDNYSRVETGSSILDTRVSRRKLWDLQQGRKGTMIAGAGPSSDDDIFNMVDRADINLSSLQNYVFSVMNVNRRIRYHLYDLMEEWHPEMPVSLDCIADESCIRGFNNEVFEIMIDKSDGSEFSDTEKIHVASIKKVLEKFLFQDLNVSKKAWGWMRNLAKYGDWFLEPILGRNGIVDIRPFYDLYSIIKVEDTDNVPYYIYAPTPDTGDASGSFIRDFSSSLIWQPVVLNHFVPSAKEQMIIYFDGELIHFKLDGKPQYQPYGTSHLDCLRQTWEILKRMEDSMMVYRMVRGPERKIFSIYTGRLPASKAVDFVNKIRSTIKRKPADGSFNFTGQSYNNIEDVDKRFRFQAADEEYWLPIQEGANGSTKIEKLEGNSNFEEIADIEYMRQKVYTGLRIPKAYLNNESDINRSTLVQQDVHFARLINRYQESLSEGIEKLCVLQLYAWYTSMNDDSHKIREVKDFLSKYKISFRWTTASVVEEKAYLESLQVKTDIAESLKNTFGEGSKEFIIKRIFQLSPEEEALLNSETATLENTTTPANTEMGSGLDLDTGNLETSTLEEMPEIPSPEVPAPTETAPTEHTKYLMRTQGLKLLREYEKTHPRIPDTGAMRGMSDDLPRANFIKFMETKFNSIDDIKLLRETVSTSVESEDIIKVDISKDLYTLLSNASEKISVMLNSKEYKEQGSVLITERETKLLEGETLSTEELLVPED